VMAWAAAHGQGAGAEAVERAATEFLGRDDVHSAPGLAERRFTTSDLLAHENEIVHGAQARRAKARAGSTLRSLTRCWPTRHTCRRQSRPE
jgi:hypothetical protein